MEIPFRYIYLKLESMLPFLFAMFYFISDTVNDVSATLPIKDKVSILTGISISLFYLTKAYKNYYLKDKISELEEEIISIKEILKKANL